MTADRRDSSAHSKTTFPDFHDQSGYSEEAVADIEGGSHSNKFVFPQRSNGAPKEHQWLPKKKERVSFALPEVIETRSRQKSLTEAWTSIRHRRGSVTESVSEIGQALKAPVSPALVLLCAGWYMCSILSNASSKSILIAFRYPVTLTVVQFAFVSSWCIVASKVAHRFPAIMKAIPALRYPIRRPSRDLIMTTLPLTAFQVGGHILNSDAMSRIPVSLVHTIKGLSPLFTVMAYRLFFRIHYSMPVYLSLIPLTLGVIMACSANVSGDFIGLLNAFGSAILFVTQNIVSKKLFNEAAQADAEGLQSTSGGAPQKPDKLNLLCYSSGLAFLITFPIWVWSDGFVLVRDLINKGTVPLTQRPDALDHGRLTLEFIFNGTFHFTQSLVAFILLSMVSPVTYSVASLIKRVFVICFAIVWFGNPVTRVQASGIALTFVGLYLYDRTHDAARAEKKARLMMANNDVPILPLIKEDLQKAAGSFNSALTFTASPVDMLARPTQEKWDQRKRSPLRRYDSPSEQSDKRRRSGPEDPDRREGVHSDPGWLPPGTRQEATWGERARSPFLRSRADGVPV